MEIKFRAWNKVENKMYTNAINNCKDSFDMILKHPQIYEVMQFTGLCDKNGAEIYEGDILKNDLVGDLWEVFRNLSRFEVGLIPNSGFIGHAQKYPQFAHSEDLMDVFDEFYKVGNKWDNPELLEVSR